MSTPRLDFMLFETAGLDAGGGGPRGRLVVTNRGMRNRGLSGLQWFLVPLSLYFTTRRDAP